MLDCYIALGSNLNNPQQQIKKALESLAALPDSRLLKTSSLHTTKPVGSQQQPDFINAVSKIHTMLQPLALLTELQRIEQQQGREPTYRWGPRVIDLDILLYADVTINLPELTIPHPRMLERMFVLKPLQELDPNVILHGKKIQYFIDHLFLQHS